MYYYNPAKQFKIGVTLRSRLAGVFLSGLILIASLGSLIGGWRTTHSYCLLLWISIIAFALIWIFTPTVFWPIIIELYRVANGKIVRTEAQVETLVRHWFVFDWLRVLAIAAGFLSSIRAISVPRPTTDSISRH